MKLSDPFSIILQKYDRLFSLSLQKRTKNTKSEELPSIEHSMWDGYSPPSKWAKIVVLGRDGGDFD